MAVKVLLVIYLQAMHLVYKALEKYTIPNTLPAELMAPSKRKGSSPVPPLLHRGMDGFKPEVPIQPMHPPQPVMIQPIIPPMAPSPTPMSMVPPAPAATVAPSAAPPVPWVVATEDKAKYDTLFIKSDVDRDGFVSGLEIKDVFLKSGVPQPILAHIW